MSLRQEMEHGTVQEPVTYSDAKSHFESYSTYQQKLDYVVNVPLLYSVADYDALPYNHPTPLDSSNVFVRGGNRFSAINGMEPWFDYALKENSNKALFAMAHMTESTVDEVIFNEMLHQALNRQEHNREAFERLKHAMDERPAIDHVLDIVLRARAGFANLPELLDLIKRYPEMISVETSHYQDYFRPSAIMRAYAQAQEDTKKLAIDFKDAELVMGGAPGELIKSGLVEHARVQKTKLGEMRSRDSCTEHMVKVIYIPSGDGVAPCAVTTYFRTADYKTAPGYQHETIDDSLAFDNDPYVGDDEVARMITNPESRQRYLEARQGMGRCATRGE